jgi:hypothetical protein
VVLQPVEQADHRRVLGQEVASVLEGPVGRDAERPVLAGRGDEADKQLRPGGVHRGEADLVDQDEVAPEDLLDDAADRVVGESPVGGLDEIRRGDIADPLPRLDRLVAERNQQVALAGPGRHDTAKALTCCDPLEALEVVEARLFDRRSGDVELLDGLDAREGAELEPGRRVGRITRRLLASRSVRRNSFGDHRWVFEVTSSSGSSRLIAD